MSTLFTCRSRGNIILDLDSHRATNLLLDLVQKTPTATRSATDLIISKEKEFYLAVAPLGAADLDGPGVTVARITSGDPARGNMAVDTVRDLVAGQVVQD
ncbi:hypothetical protein BC936DRAFT_138812 [Jimgerdemannia flammicorona]|uniref:Uncharacterized protein n=1 Tax=Jimgerdemannia flammicorona TaxID=994334 RepID=A0A433BHU5_9FUNG|nr:hypothetical protein BC936DRAFT_138812 [Jimgerdemannia flammicorona]